jgi:hypothetical protein
VNCISDQQQKVDDKVIYYRLYSGIPVIHGGEHVKFMAACNKAKSPNQALLNAAKFTDESGIK